MRCWLQQGLRKWLEPYAGKPARPVLRGGTASNGRSLPDLTEGTWILAFIPVLGGILDLAENVQITAMLVQYPNVGTTQVAWASAFTSFKGWIGPVYQLLGLGLLLLAALDGAVRAIRGRRSGS